jgi:hypothetical protein
MATPPLLPPDPPVDSVRQVIDFARAQADAEIANIERLFTRAKTMFGWVLLVASGVAVFFGFSTYQGLKSAVTSLVNDGMKRQVPQEIDNRLQKEKIETLIQEALNKKTESQFEGAIDKAVARELDTPPRQRLFDDATYRQVELWFQKHPDFIRTAVQQQIAVLTKHLEARDKVLALSDEALGPGQQSGAAIDELSRMMKNDPDEATRKAARSAMAQVRTFWIGSSYILDINHRLEASGKKTVCELLIMLHSPIWQDRRVATYLLMLKNQKGVMKSLIRTLQSDPYAEVRAGAFRTLQMAGMTDLEDFPDPTLLDNWWNTYGKGMEAKFDESGCQVN